MAEEPPYLVVGTEVSAKYRGAFCEAKVKKVVKSVKCRVSLKEGGSLVVQDDDIRGSFKIGRSVEVKHPDSGQYLEGVLLKVMDQSMYTVIFDDADENTLRRTQLCLKGDKHFVKSETLDDLPLTHPEHFGTPVVKGGKGYKRKRAAAPDMNGSDSEIDDTSSEDSVQQKRTYRRRLQDLVGRVLCIEIDDRKKTLWVPVLVTQPTADEVDLKSRDHLLVKSFKDSRFYTVSRRDAKDFTRDMAVKNEDKALKAAFEKALLYYDTRDLPQNWDKEELLGSDSADEDESDSSDDEPSEEKDRFVAQLFKFMDDRGTPINKAPLIANRDLNLYRLFRLVQNLGGYNRVTNQMKWRLVYSKMNLPSSTNASNQIKTAYKKFLHAFEDFYRKLGSTMGTISRPSRSRHSSGRSLLSFRERESSAPKSPGRASKKSRDSDSESELDMEDDMKPDSPVPDRIKTRSKLEGLAKASKEESESESELDEKPVTRKGRTTRQTEEKKKDEAKETPTKPATRETAKLAKEREFEDKKRHQEKAVERKSRKDLKEEETPSERDEEDEDKLKKRQTRKKSARLAADSGEKAEDKDESDPKTDKTRKRIEKVRDEEKDLSDEEEIEKSANDDEYPLGTKLKVKYGKGKNQKLYEAKVLEIEREGIMMHYKVHYAGWNNRYDEWVKKERIVGVLSEPESKKGKHRPPPKPAKKEKEDSYREKEEFPTAIKKRGRPSEVDKDGRDSPRGKGRVANITPAKSQRPTRSTSVDNTHLSGGLPPKQRRTRRSSGMGPDSASLRESESENEASDDENAELTESKNDSCDEESIGGPPSPMMEDVDISSKDKSIDDDHFSDGGPEDDMEDKEFDDLPDLANMRRRKDKVVISEDEKDNKSEDSKMSKLTFDSDEEEDKDFEMEHRKLKIIESLEADDKSVKSADKEETGSNSDNLSQKDDTDKDSDHLKTKLKRKSKRRTSETEAAPKEETPSELPSNKTGDSCITDEISSITESKMSQDEQVKPDDTPKKKGKLIRKEKVPVAVESPSKPKQVKVEKKPIKRKVEELPKAEDLAEEKSPKKKMRRKKKEDEKLDTTDTCLLTAAAPSVKVTTKQDIPLSKANTEHVSNESESNISLEPASQLIDTDVIEPKAPLDCPAPHLSPVSSAKPAASDGKSSATTANKSDKDQEAAGVGSSNASLYVNTPPETPEGSPGERDAEGGQSPSQEDSASTKSERDANLEVATLMEPTPVTVAESPNTCDISTLSNTSGGSSGNVPGSESECPLQSTSFKRPKEEVEVTVESEKPLPAKRRKRSHKKGTERSKRTPKNTLSDSDEASAAEFKSVSPTKSTSQSSVAEDRPKGRTPKYNFVNMSEYQNLESDDRVKYLFGKIADLKKIYMGLKAEVACIDRRRKRHRRKERENTGAGRVEVPLMSSLEKIESS